QAAAYPGRVNAGLTPHQSLVNSAEELRDAGATPSSRLTRFHRFEREPIAGTSDSLKILGLLRERFDFFPQAADVDVHVARGHKAVASPNFVQQFFAAENVARVRSQE